MLFVMTLIFQMIFRSKKRKVYYRLHRFFGIAAFVLALAHGTAAVLYFYGIV